MYSSVTLREIFIVLFVQVFVLSYMRWDETRLKKDLLLSFLAASVHILLHNPMFLVLMSAYIYQAYRYLKKSINFKKMTIKPAFLLIISASIVIIFTGVNVNVNGMYMPYIGNFEDFGLDRIVSYGKNTNYGNALYPSFIVPSSSQDVITLLPLRVVYFLFSPFLWDITSVSHIFGLFDSLFYMYLSYLFFLNRHYVMENKKLKVIMLIFIIGVVLYSFGVGNFANAMRHRTKFLMLLVLIVAPFLFKKKGCCQNNKVLEHRKGHQD